MEPSSTDIAIQQAPVPAVQAAPPMPVQLETSPAVRLTLETVEGCMALQRMGEIFASSTVVPSAYQGNVSNCIVALDIASRMQLSPMTVFQNMYIIQGKPSWASPFIIALFNKFATNFGPMQFEFFGQPGTSSRGCVAYAVQKNTGMRVNGPEVTLGMASAERWGPKWRTMPELMLRYRAAAFFVRTTCPEILFGLYAQEEQEDIIAANSNGRQQQYFPAAEAVVQVPQPRPEDRVQKMVVAFEGLGVSIAMLVHHLGHDVANITHEELDQLRSIFVRIKNNPQDIVEIFPEQAPSEAPVEESAAAPEQDATEQLMEEVVLLEQELADEANKTIDQGEQHA